MGRDGGVPFQAFLEWQENGGRGGQGCAFGGPPLTTGVSDGVLGYVPVRVLSAHTVITLRGRYYYFHFPAPKQKDREVTYLLEVEIGFQSKIGYKGQVPSLSQRLPCRGLQADFDPFGPQILCEKMKSAANILKLYAFP